MTGVANAWFATLLAVMNLFSFTLIAAACGGDDDDASNGDTDADGEESTAGGESGHIAPHPENSDIVYGGSYGGYMVNAVLARYPDSFAAGVSLFGVADWVTALQIASPALKASARIEYGDIREQKWIDYYTENSPIRMADQIKVPVLYSHGVMDPRIDIYETEVMVKTLRANGIEAPYIRIEDEGHGWRKLSTRLFYYRAQAEFLEEIFSGEE